MNDNISLKFEYEVRRITKQDPNKIQLYMWQISLNIWIKGWRRQKKSTNMNGYIIYPD